MASKPHVVMFPYPGPSHINPMMELAKRLSSQGVQLTVITLEYFVARITQNNTLGSNDISLMGIPDGLSNESRNRSTISQALQKLGGAMEAALHRLMDQGPPITCIIGDCYVQSVRDLAIKFNIPRVAFWAQCATTFSIQFHINHIIAGGFNPFERTVKSFGTKEPMDLIASIPGVPPLHPAHLPFYTAVGKAALQFFKNFQAQIFGNLHEAFAVLCNSFEELEPRVCEALPNFGPIGPLLPPALLGEENPQGGSTLVSSSWKEEDCIPWLDLQLPSSVLYIAFGGYAELTIAQVQEIAFGLLASQQTFLWVIRPDSVVDSMTNALDALPHAFLHQIKEKGKIINWAPQPLVLAHTSVAGFFSHCGWNSTLESISMGVPMLGWPHMVDQNTNCWMVASQWKVGLELKRDQDNNTDRVEVERAVRELMEGQSAQDMRIRASKLKNAARRSVEANRGSSHRHLQLFIDRLYHMAQVQVYDV